MPQVKNQNEASVIARDYLDKGSVIVVDSEGSVYIDPLKIPKNSFVVKGEIKPELTEPNNGTT